MGASAMTPRDGTATDEPLPPAPSIADPVPEPVPAPETAPPAEPPPLDPELDDEPPLPLSDAVDPWAGPARWIKHRVVPRESLSQIAARYGVKLTNLRKWNRLDADDIVKPRDKLKIYARRFPPAREKMKHVVAEGDTWGSIARAYGVSPRDLRAYNVRKTGRRLDLGEQLQIWIDPVIYEHLQGHVAEPGPTADIYPGGYSVGTPNEGHLINAARIPDSDDYELRFPKGAYGTSHAVEQVVLAMRDFRERSGFEGKVRFGTMSRINGGEVGHHKSHQSGRDIDIRLPVRAGVPEGLRPKVRTIDWEATWHLINAFIDTGEVAVIFLEYKRQKYVFRQAKKMGIPEDEIDRVLQWPVGRAASRGMVRHSPGHEVHIHVRFRCGPHETECTD
jgi:LysM repeat protein